MCERPARSAPPRRLRGCSWASADRGRWATSASPRRVWKSSRSTPSRICSSCAGPCQGPVVASWRFEPMLEAPVLGAGRKINLDETAFGARFLGALVHQSVRAEQAARRRGTASTKTRGMGSGGGAKPWRQKGTGRARAGSNRSPIWTGGGTVFGPKPRSYTFKVNRKEQRAALRGALSLHAERGSIAVVDAAAFKAPKTRRALELLEGWGQAR